MIQQSPTEERAREVLRAAVANRDPTGASVRKMETDGVVDVGVAVDALMELTSQAAQPAEADGVEPIPMLLFCPVCHLQHIDEPDEHNAGWDNPPHRSHLCHGCGNIWRPADVPTEGVRAIATIGKADTWLAATPKAPATDAGEVERLARVIQAEARDKGADSPVDYGDAEQIARAALATPPAPNDDLRAAWETGRDAALKEVADYARSCRHLVSPIFVPAIEGIAATLQAPAALKENRRG